jgi:hypothetical protein
MSKPKTIKEYIEWAKENLSSNFNSESSKTLYDINLGTAHQFISTHPFISLISTRAVEWQEKYKKRTKSQLLMSNLPFEIHQKPYKSALNKSFRENILWNRNYPNRPDKGWVTDENIFKYFDDGIRTTLVCKFIDGPEYVVRQLSQLAKECDIKCHVRPQAKDEGYYAYHFYTQYEIGLIDKNLEPIPKLLAGRD